MAKHLHQNPKGQTLTHLADNIQTNSKPVLINFRVPESLKDAFDVLCKAFGHHATIRQLN